jgi:hypothetical protein
MFFLKKLCAEAEFIGICGSRSSGKYFNKGEVDDRIWAVAIRLGRQAGIPMNPARRFANPYEKKISADG